MTAPPDPMDQLAQDLFEAEPHRHPRGLVPQWAMQPQHLKNIYRRRAHFAYLRGE